MHRMPEIIAHRGLPREHTENTLASFTLAIERGADGIELDVHETADGVVVVHHDPVLPAPHGNVIAETAYAALADCELPGGGRVPRLSEVLRLAGGVTTYVEVKAPGIEASVAAELTEAPGAVAVHAFDHRIPVAVGTVLPAVPRGILQASYLVDTKHALIATGARDLWQHWPFIDGHLVLAARAAGARVVAWTVNGPDDAVRLATLGVAAICTDRCDAIRRALTDAGFVAS